jgi:hypothetical protein
MAYEFTHVVDFIFKNKERYNDLSDKDKETFFFIINRKFAREYPVHAQFFNKKNSNKATAMDIWFSFFQKKGTIDTPKWYWFTKNTNTESVSSIITKKEIEYFMDYYDITEDDIMYLIKNHLDDFKEEIKKLRRFNK